MLPFLPLGVVRFDGEFRRDSGLVVLTPYFVEIDPKPTFAIMSPASAFSSWGGASERGKVSPLIVIACGSRRSLQRCSDHWLPLPAVPRQHFTSA